MACMSAASWKRLLPSQSSSLISLQSHQLDATLKFNDANNIPSQLHQLLCGVRSIPLFLQLGSLLEASKVTHSV